jgi:hypothetical protein
VSEGTAEFRFSDNLEQVRQSLQTNLRGIVSDLESAGQQLDGRGIGTHFLDGLSRNLATEGTKILQQAENIAEELKRKLQLGESGLKLNGSSGFGGQLSAQLPDIGKQVGDFVKAQFASLPDAAKANPEVQRVITEATNKLAQTLAEQIRNIRVNLGDAARAAGASPKGTGGETQPERQIASTLSQLAGEFRSTVSGLGKDIGDLQSAGREVAERIRAAAAGGGGTLTPGDNQAVRKAGSDNEGPLAGSVLSNANQSAFVVQLDPETRVVIQGSVVKGFEDSQPIIDRIFEQAAEKARVALLTPEQQGRRVVEAVRTGDAIPIKGGGTNTFGFPATGEIARLDSNDNAKSLSPNTARKLDNKFQEQLAASERAQAQLEEQHTAALTASIEADGVFEREGLAAAEATVRARIQIERLVREEAEQAQQALRIETARVQEALGSGFAERSIQDRNKVVFPSEREVVHLPEGENAQVSQVAPAEQQKILAQFDKNRADLADRALADEEAADAARKKAITDDTAAFERRLAADNKAAEAAEKAEAAAAAAAVKEAANKAKKDAADAEAAAAAARKAQAEKEAADAAEAAARQAREDLVRRNRAANDVEAGQGLQAGRVTFSSQGITETGTGKIVTDFNQLRAGSEALAAKLEELEGAFDHANKSPIDGLVQGLFGAGGRKRTGGAQPVDGDSPLFGLFETAGVVAKYEVLGRGIGSLGQAATGAVKDFADLDEATRAVNEVFGTSINTSSQYITNLENIAASAGQASKALIEASTSAGAAFGGDTGAGRQQAAQESAPTIAQSTAITGQDLPTSATQLIAIGNAYQLTASQLGAVTNAVANARNAFGGNAAEIQKGLAAIAVVGPQAGFSLEQLAAAVGKAQAATGEGGTQIASSLTRIFNVLGKESTRTNLAKNLGLDLTGDAKNNIEQLAAAFPSLSDSQRRFLEDQAGGARGLRILVPLLNDQPGLQAAYKRALNDTDAGQKAANASINSLAGQLRQFGNDLKNLGVDIAKSGLLDPLVLIFETIKPGIEVLDRLVQAFDRLPGSVKGFIFTVGEALLAFNAFKLLAEKGVVTSVTGLGAQVGGIFTGAKNAEGETTKRGLFTLPGTSVKSEVSPVAAERAAQEELAAAIKQGAAEVRAAEIELADAATAGGAESAAAVTAQSKLALVQAESSTRVAAANDVLVAATAQRTTAEAAATAAAAAGTGAAGARTAADAAAAAATATEAAAAAEYAAATAGLTEEEVALGRAIAETIAEYETSVGVLDGFIGTVTEAAAALQAFAARALASGLAGASLNEAGAVVGKAGLLARLGLGAEGVGIAGAGLGLTAGVVGGGLLFDKAIFDNQQKRFGAFDESTNAVGAVNGVSSVADTRKNAIDLNKAADDIGKASSGVIGSLTGALSEVFGGQNRGLERRFDKSLALEENNSAGRISAAQDGASSGAGAFDLTQVGGVAEGFKNLAADGATAQQQLDLLTGVLGQVAGAAKGAAFALLPGQANVLAARTGGAIASQIASSAAIDADLRNTSNTDVVTGTSKQLLDTGVRSVQAVGHFFGIPGFGSDGPVADAEHLTSSKTDQSRDGEKLKKIDFDALGKGLTEDTSQAIKDTGLDSGPITKEKTAAAVAELQKDLKDRLKKLGIDFSHLAPEVQKQLLDAAGTGLQESIAAITGGKDGKITKDNIDAVLANAPQAAARAGQEAAVTASLNGDARGGALTGATTTLADLQDVRAKLVAAGASDAQLADFDKQIEKVQLDVQNATIAHVQALDQLAAASVSPFKKAGQIDAQIKTVNDRIATETDVDKKNADQAALIGLQNQKKAQVVADAKSLARVGVDSRDVVGNATQDLADANAALKAITDTKVTTGQAFTDAQKAVNDATVKLAQTNVDNANALRDANVAVGDTVGEAFAHAQDLVDQANADRAGSAKQATDQRAATAAGVTANLAADARLTAQNAAKIDPRNVLADDKNTLAGLQQQLKDTAPGDANAIAALTRQIATQNIKVRQDQLDLAKAQRDAAVDPRDTVGQADAAVTDAKDALTNLLPGTAAYAAAQRAYKNAVIADAQAKTDLANAARDASVFPGDALGAARAALDDAAANLKNDKPGTLKYYTDLKGLRAAQVAYVQAIEAQETTVEALNTDQTNPLQQAQNQVDAAKRKLADDKRLGAPASVIQQDQLSLTNAQNNEQKTAFQQQLSDAQTNLQLHRISGAAYLQYLNEVRKNVLATGLKTRQQVDELNQVDQAILSANQQLQGQFNLGDIKVPTVFQERQQAGVLGIKVTPDNPIAAEPKPGAADPLQTAATGVILPLVGVIQQIKTDAAVSALTALQTAINGVAKTFNPTAAGAAKAPANDAALLTDLLKAGNAAKINKVDDGAFRKADISRIDALISQDAARLASDERHHASTATIQRDKLALNSDRAQLANVTNHTQINGADFAAVVKYLQGILGNQGRTVATTGRKQ